MTGNTTKCTASDGVTQVFDFGRSLPLMVQAVDFNALYTEYQRVRERVIELETDPNSGDPIPLAEPRCGDLRRAAERCITAWTVVRGGVWDPNGLMDEHMAALRKALIPNVIQGALARFSVRKDHQ